MRIPPIVFIFILVLSVLPGLSQPGATRSISIDKSYGDILSVATFRDGKLALVAINLSANPPQRYLVLLDKNGHRIADISSMGDSESQYRSVFRVKVNQRTNELWVPDFGSAKILIFDGNNKFLRAISFAKPVEGPGDVALSSNGSVYYTASCVNESGRNGCTSRIRQHDIRASAPTAFYLDNTKDLNFINKGYYRLSMPALAIDGSGRILFSDIPDRALWLVNPTNNQTTRFALDSFLPAAPVMNSSSDAGTFYRTHLTASGVFSWRNLVLLGIHDPTHESSAFLMLDPATSSIRRVASPLGELVGQANADQMIFAAYSHTGIKLTITSPASSIKK